MRDNDADEEDTIELPAGDKQEDTADIPVPKPAPLHTVNAWDARKKTLPGAANTEEQPAKADSAPVLQFGTVVPAVVTISGTPINRMTNGDEGVKIAKTKKAMSAPTSAMTAMPDVNAWPDVAQAADKVAEEKKDKTKEKKGSEESSVVEDGSVSGSTLLIHSTKSKLTKRREAKVDGDSSN